MFEIETSLIFWSAVSFVLLLLLLKKLVLPTLLELMEARKQKIKSDLSSAAQAQEEALANSAKSKISLHEAKVRAEKIISDSTQNAQSLKAEILNKAESRAGQIIDLAQTKIQNETQRAKQALQNEIAALVVEAGSKVIPKILSDADHQKIIEDGLKELDKTA